MGNNGSSVRVQTDQSQYVCGDHAVISVFVKINKQPAVNEMVRVYVFCPDGKRVFSQQVATNKYGIAVVIYRLQKKSTVGNYSVEAHSSDECMALTSFLLF